MRTLHNCNLHPPPSVAPLAMFFFPCFVQHCFGFIFAQAAEHAAAEARAVAAENARAAPVFISGATGDNAARINGFYEPTQEKGLDGRVLYAKRGDASMCIEHYGGNWRVKPVSSKGKDVCYACVEGGCGLDACASRVWMLHDGKAWIDAPSVKLVLESEVRRCCACSRCSLQLTPARVPLLTSPIADSRRQGKGCG